MYELELYSLTALLLLCSFCRYQKIQDELYNPEFTLTFLKILTWSEPKCYSNERKGGVWIDDKRSK